MRLIDKMKIFNSPFLFLKGRIRYYSSLLFFGICEVNSKMICCKDNIPHKLPSGSDCKCGGIPMIMYDDDNV